MNDDEIIEQHRVASRLAARAEIRDVRLLRTSAELVRQPEPDGRLTYDLAFDTSADWDEDITDSFVIRFACTLSVSSVGVDPLLADEGLVEGDDDESYDESQVAAVDFEYAALFDCVWRDGDGPLAEEELIAYGATTARFLLYPFVREYIYDLTGRLALPPLTIGVMSRPMPATR